MYLELKKHTTETLYLMLLLPPLNFDSIDVKNLPGYKLRSMAIHENYIGMRLLSDRQQKWKG